MKWDHGVRNSYRMGAEGKYDLKLANCDNLPLLESGSTSSTTVTPVVTAGKKSNVLGNRKSSSTPSLPEATEGNISKNSVASTEQASSADNLSWKQAVETIAENVLSSAKSDIVTGTDARATNQTEVSVVVHALRELENHQDLSLINHTPSSGPPMSDLATITENYALNNDNIKNNATTSNTFLRQQSFPDEKVSNIEANNKMNASNSAHNISKTLHGATRTNSGARLTQISSEAFDAIDKMREGVDMIRNNANNIISSDIMHLPSGNLHPPPPIKIAVHKNLDSSNSNTDPDKYKGKLKPIHVLQPNKRQILSLEEACSSPPHQTCPIGAIAMPSAVLKERDSNTTSTTRTNITIAPTVLPPPSSIIPIVVSTAMHALSTTTPSTTSTESNTTSQATTTTTNESAVVVANPMSVSVPNLTSSSNNEATNQIEPVSPPGLLETFAALARRRTSQGSSFQSNNQVSSHSSNSNNNQHTSSFFPRGQNSVSSLVKLALSSNFHSGLLSTAQSYPSLTSAATNTSNNILNSMPTTVSSQGTTINPALTMSLTSTSSDSEQVSFEDFLESCRAPTLLGELEDEEDMDDDNDDEENEDEYEEVGVSKIKS